MKTDFDVHAGIDAIVDYLKKDESLKKGSYYSKGLNDAEAKMTQAIWAGSLMQELGLEGRAYDDMFSKLQDGILPDGQKMRGKNQNGDEILLHDMTLSAPKSFTLHALEDPRLFDCHIKACQKTIAAAEQYYAVYLEGKDRHTVLGQGLMAAIIPHWTNRNLEPQLHCHCALFNGTKTKEGKWRSFHMHPISRERWMGSYFRSVLAQEAQAIGYKTYEVPMENGAWGFEIEGLTREQIEHFSSRTTEIHAAMEEKGWDSNKATLKTRKRKGAQPSWDELRQSAREARAELGATLQTPSEVPQQTKTRSADEAVQSAIDHLSERHCRFTKFDILQQAFNHVEAFSPEDVEIAIAKNPTLIDYGLIKSDKKRIGELTTVEALKRETRTIDRWFQGNGTVAPILDRAGTIHRIDTLHNGKGDILNHGQLEAVLGILESTDQHQILHGLSGVGKTRTLKPLKKVAESEGVKLKWFAPSLDAAQKLSQEIGAPADTLQRLVYTDYRINQDDVLVIDEAGLASAEMIDILVEKANAVGARILLVGDTGQNRPINAGTPVISLIEAGATTHHVSEILRQKNDVQRQAVILASKGNATDALNLLDKEGYVEEVEDREQRAQEIADYYLALLPEERKNTLIVAGTHAEKDAIVAKIREGLKAEGTLGESASITQLRDKSWTKEQTRDIRNYEVGDYVAISRAAEKCSLIKDEFYAIVSKNDERLIVQSVTGENYVFNPQTAFPEKRVFSAQEFDISIGDELRWQHTNYKKFRKNGDTFKVVAIEGAWASIESKGKVRRIRLSDPIAVDYTLTTTNYRAQGSDRPRVLVSATDDPTSNKQAFYVKISRQIHDIKIWTSNLVNLRRRVARSNNNPNPLKGIRNEYFGFINKSTNLSTKYRDSWTFGSAPIHSRPAYGQIGQHASYSVDGDGRKVEQTTGGREQNTGSRWKSFNLNRQLSNVSGAKQTSIRPSKRIDRARECRNHSSEKLTAGDLDPSQVEEIIQLAYQKRLREALSDPLAKLSQALTELENSKEKNKQLLREQAIVRAEAKAVSIALQEWKEGQVEPLISYAIEAVKEAVPPSFEDVFWHPESSPPIGDINENHWSHFEKSCIHPDILALNAESISGKEVYDRLLSHKLSTMGTGQFVTTGQARLMNRYAGVAVGGWWARGGHNPQNFNEPQEWGTFKPNLARMAEGKRIKYESPLGMPRGIFLPYVPDSIAQGIYKKYGIQPTTEDLQRGFWAIVRDYNVPIVITEGAKKTWASLSQGFATIGVSGVNGLYITKDEHGNKLKERRLNPDIAVFATQRRQFTIAFDQDTKPKTIVNVRRDLVRGVELLTEAGCPCKVATWGTETKGLDDLIYKNGPKAYIDAINNAESPTAAIDAHYAYQYNRIAEMVQRRYGAAGTQEKLDTAIAYFCHPKELFKTIAHSPAIEKASEMEAKFYLETIRDAVMELTEKLSGPTTVSLSAKRESRM